MPMPPETSDGGVSCSAHCDGCIRAATFSYRATCDISEGRPATPARDRCHKLLSLRAHAAVAQLDRVLGYEPRGRGFNSCQPHQNFGSRTTA